MTQPRSGYSAAELAGDPQRRLDPGVVLHVQRHRGARVARRGADPADVLGRGPAVLEEQPDRGRLDRHLGGAAVGQPGRAELAEQPDVLVGDGGGLLRVGGVLAQVVQRDQQPGGAQRPGHPHRVVGGLARPRTGRPRRGCCGAVVMSWRIRSLAEAASSARRSTGDLPVLSRGSGLQAELRGAPQRHLDVRPGVRRHDDLLRGGDAAGQQRRVHRHRPLDQRRARSGRARSAGRPSRRSRPSSPSQPRPGPRARAAGPRCRPGAGRPAAAADDRGCAPGPPSPGPGSSPCSGARRSRSSRPRAGSSGGRCPGRAAAVRGDPQRLVRPHPRRRGPPPHQVPAASASRSRATIRSIAPNGHGSRSPHAVEPGRRSPAAGRAR